MLLGALLLVLAELATGSAGKLNPLLLPGTPNPCEQCGRWNRPHPPVHVFGNTWWVGVEGLSVIAIDTGEGLILLDGGLPQSVPLVRASLAAAGLGHSGVKLIGNSHAHYDHAGGIAELQRDSGATVLASARGAEALRAGCPNPDDPQAAFGCETNGFPRAPGPIRVVRDGEVVRLGNVELTAHLTTGHTPGSTTWTWKACEGNRCLAIVYADSLNPVAAEGFLFRPIASEFRSSMDKVAALPCDALLTPHPDASSTLERLSRSVDGGMLTPRPGECAEYAAKGRAKLDARLASEPPAQPK